MYSCEALLFHVEFLMHVEFLTVTTRSAKQQNYHAMAIYFYMDMISSI